MAKLTKQQFIKRVEEITSWKYENYMEKHQYFRFEKNKPDDWFYIEIYTDIWTDDGKTVLNVGYQKWCDEEDGWIQQSFDIPEEWRILIGEAIKEYYG